MTRYSFCIVALRARKIYFYILMKKFKTIFCIWLFFTGLWIVITITGAFETFDAKILDCFLRNSSRLVQDTNIVVVEYDDKTSENMDGPVTGSDLAALIHIIEEHNPKVIALDVFSLSYLIGKSDSALFEEQVFTRYPNICYGVGFLVPIGQDEKAAIPRASEFIYRDYSKGFKSVGHLVLKNDADGVFRRMPSAIQCGNGFLYTLGLQAAFDFLDINKEQVTLTDSRIVIRNTDSLKFTGIPIDRSARLLIKFNDARDKIHELSMIDVMVAYKNPSTASLNLDIFKGKLVFVGNTSSRTARFCATPLYSYYPAMLLHANVANNMFHNAFLCMPSIPASVLMIFLLGILCVIPMVFCQTIAKVLWLALVLPLLLLLDYLLYCNCGFFFPLFTLGCYFTLLFSALLVNRYLDYKDSLIISLRSLQDALRLKERLAAIGEVSSKVAHEIRNPLNGIKLYTSLLKRDNVEKEDAWKFLDIIHQEINRLDNFLTTLLKYAKTREPVRRPLNILAELVASQDLLLSDIQNRNIKVSMKVPETIEINADPDQIREIFINLMKNAVEAMEQGGTLDISSGKANAGITLFFRDTGAGMTAEQMAHVFDAFYTTKKQGTGLGLAIVKKNIDAHHGRIQINSEPGKGTTIEVNLPLDGKKEYSV